MKPWIAVLAVGTLVASVAARPAVPARLSETGLYLPGSTIVDPRNRPFSPQYPLWTDGAEKARWIQLPPGARIDAHDANAWTFPVGTKLWKEFAFAGRNVETRLLWRTGRSDWSYASYVWNADGTDATLAPPEGVAGAAEIAPGARHNVPSREDCRACHEAGAGPALGFTALQLSPDRDPAAPHAEPLRAGMLTLQTLLDEDLLASPHPTLAARPPRIPGDVRTRAVLGYLSANCGHCHNEASSVATVRHPLLMPAYASSAEVRRIVDTLRSTVTKWDVPHTTPGTTSLVAPGSPERSALFVRMRSRRPSSQMPPIGTVILDREGLDLVRGWIGEMRGGER